MGNSQAAVSTSGFGTGHGDSKNRHGNADHVAVSMEIRDSGEVGFGGDGWGDCGVAGDGKLRRQVFLRLVFTKIGDIDTVRECFDASVYLEAQWREPSLDFGVANDRNAGGASSAAASDVAPSESNAATCHWHPDLYIDNSIGDLMHRRDRELSRNSSGEAFVLERHSLRGRFFERMELTFTDEQEWSLHTHVEASKTSVISDSQIGPRQRPAVQFSTRATRRATFYVVNIWFVSFILCMLALCVFGIDRQNLQGRLQLSFILLLTTVTFKFVIANHIPRVSYLTMLDKAVMHNLLFLVLLSIWHSVASLFPATHSLQANEKYAIIVFAGVYVLGICVILLQIVFGALKRKKLMDEKDLQYQMSTRNQISPFDEAENGESP
uniref:Neur_chan_LBD domain-containing protein n=1 Tax=Macrostomum lignano TaxID=282301 RepID=A0A1I8H246_9PLAT